MRAGLLRSLVDRPALVYNSRFERNLCTKNNPRDFEPNLTNVGRGRVSHWRDALVVCELQLAKYKGSYGRSARLCAAALDVVDSAMQHNCGVSHKIKRSRCLASLNAPLRAHDRAGDIDTVYKNVTTCSGLASVVVLPAHGEFLQYARQL